MPFNSVIIYFNHQNSDGRCNCPKLVLWWLVQSKVLHIKICIPGLELDSSLIDIPFTSIFTRHHFINFHKKSHFKKYMLDSM